MAKNKQKIKQTDHCPSCNHNISRSRCKPYGIRKTKTLTIFQYSLRCNGCKTQLFAEIKLKTKTKDKVHQYMLLLFNSIFKSKNIALSDRRS